ncbi:MAG: GxxExxY protein [Defluviitaleaceae bacterium]|nr:GxxExxY protein [Defluviitaleaceae bacterium]
MGLLIHQELTKTIIGCFYKVYNTLGYGFLEHVYENAMVHELSKNQLLTKRQFAIEVYYENIVVGQYFADILVEDKIILELKAVSELNDVHKAQLMNYLKATGKNVGLLMNFGIEAKYHRLVNTSA